MPKKPTKAEGAAVAAPRRTTPTRDRKATLPLMSAREVAAANTSGWVDETVPTAVIDLLNASGIIDAEVREKIASALGNYRFYEQIRTTRLTQAEIKQQALATAAIAAELQKRMRKLDPGLNAMIVEHWWKSHDAVPGAEPNFNTYWSDQIEPGLHYAVTLLRCAAGKIKAGAPGRKANWNRDRLLRAVVTALPVGTQQHNASLASSILAAAGIAAPSDERTQRRKVSGAK